jgi:hypothetical protein
MRANYFILLLLVLSARQSPTAHAQTPVNPTAEQLMQVMRSQPAVDISAPVTAVAAFDPPLVGPGEKAVYRVKFNATAISVNIPEKLPAPPELKIHLNASGQTMQAVEGKYQNLATFDYDVRASAPGQFTMPEFTAEVYGQPVVIPAARLEVKTDLPEPHELVRQLLVEPTATNVYVGEVFDVRVLLPATAGGAVEGMSDLQLNGDSFVVDKNAARQAIRPVEVNGRNLPAYVYETSLTPIAAGKLNLSAQGFTAGMNFGGQIIINGQLTIPGGPPALNLLDSEPVAINVRPLPTEGELPGFLGAVGSYTSDPPDLATNTLKAGEPVQLTVVIRGRKNLNRLNPPTPPHADGWQIFPAERGGIVPAANNQEAGASFKYTLIPLTDTVRATPAIPFSCFDPASGKYVDLTIPAVALTVVGEGLPVELRGYDEKYPAPLKLSELATSAGKTAASLKPLQLQGWFVAVQFVPVLGLVALWQWDRRRRFFEAHPEIVRRRHAKRALRREKIKLQKAVDANDAPAFVRHAADAMRIAVAPHFPAQPQALVSGDVLTQLDETVHTGLAGETVRKIFSAADARFALETQAHTDLLALKPDVEAVLSKLEVKL